jgi:D-alanyl-D-alanine dipeptidase
MHTLVEIQKQIPSVKLDLRYATRHNITHTKLYPVAKAYAVSKVVDALEKVQAQLAEQGLGLVIWDAYRPLSVTKQLNEATPPEQKSFVADPVKGSIHNRGCAIDATLYSLETGHELSGPSAFDEFDEKASPYYKGGSVLKRTHRDTLRHVMEENGFTVEYNEWWHYNWHEWEQYDVLDIPIKAL